MRDKSTDYGGNSQFGRRGAERLSVAGENSRKIPDTTKPYLGTSMTTVGKNQTFRFSRHSPWVGHFAYSHCSPEGASTADTFHAG